MDVFPKLVGVHPHVEVGDHTRDVLAVEVVVGAVHVADTPEKEKLEGLIFFWCNIFALFLIKSLQLKSVFRIRIILMLIRIRFQDDGSGSGSGSGSDLKSNKFQFFSV